MKHLWFSRIGWVGASVLVVLYIALVVLYPLYAPA